MAPTRWGIASAGKICHDFVNALGTLSSEDHQVIAVAARSEENAKDFAVTFGIPKWYGGYEKLAQDPDVEVVYVGAINPAHITITKMMLNAGKHVLCEKPMGMNIKETREMVELAKQKKLFLMEAVWSRFQPAYIKMAEQLSTIGDIYSADASFGQPIANPRIAKKDLGGGTVLDLGIYCINFLCMVFGGERPEKIVVAGVLNSEGTDESVSVTFMYKNGRMGTWRTHSKVRTDCVGRVHGTKGTLTLQYPFWCASNLETPDGNFSYDLPEGKEPFNFLNSAGFRYEAEHVRECLMKGLTESPKMSLQDTMLLAELMEDVRKQVGVQYDQD